MLQHLLPGSYHLYHGISLGTSKHFTDTEDSSSLNETKTNRITMTKTPEAFFFFSPHEQMRNYQQIT